MSSIPATVAAGPIAGKTAAGIMAAANANLPATWNGTITAPIAASIGAGAPPPALLFVVEQPNIAVAATQEVIVTMSLN